MVEILPVRYQARIYRNNVISNRRTLYVFGDNAARYGLGGQAKDMRGEPNSHGIATLWRPGVFFDDNKLSAIIGVLTTDIHSLRDRAMSGSYTHIVFPADGIGTGLARMKESAPLAFEFMNDFLYLALGITNGYSQITADAKPAEQDAASEGGASIEIGKGDG